MTGRSISRPVVGRVVQSVGRSLLLLSLAAASGCSLWKSSSPKPVPSDLGANVPVLGVRQAWSARIGAVGKLPLDPHVAGHVVTVASADGVVAAIDARTGGDIWRTNIADGISAGVGSNGSVSAVVTKNRELVVLNSGRELWRQLLPAQVFTPPLVAGGRVFVASADRAVTAFDGATGRRLWTQQRPGDPLVLRQSGVLQAVGDTLVTGFSGRLVGLNPDNGSVRWEAPIAVARGTNDIERLVELVGRTARSGDTVCARAFQAAVGCVNAARGAVIWTQAAAGAEGVHGDSDAIYGTESNGTVIAWNQRDGTRLWSVDQLRHRRLTAPLVLGRSVVVGDDAGLVHLLSRADGAPLNRLSTDGSGIAAAPEVAADTLVVITRNGAIYGFRPD